MASHLPSWNLLCSTSFIKLTSRKPSWHHFLIHPAYSFLQHPSFLFTVVLYITIFKIHLFCDATLSTDCCLDGLYASLLHTHMWWQNHYFHDGFCLKVQILSLLKRNLSKSLKGRRFNPEKTSLCATREGHRPHNHLQLLQTYSKGIGTPCPGAPIFWLASKVCIF